MFMARHIVSVASTSTNNYKQCSGVGAWAKHGVCQQQKALRKASRKQRTAVQRVEVAKGK